MKNLYIYLLLVIAFNINNFPQGSNDQGNMKSDSLNYRNIINDVFDKEIPAKDNYTGKPILPSGITVDILDEVTKAKYFESLRSYFQYRIDGYSHRKSVFEWQLVSSKITFIVVIFLVIAGIIFSGLQFYNSLKSKKDHDEEEVTEIVASLKGIKVSSPVLGVIILVFSLLFFYLYLVHVYPIQEIF